MKQNNLAPLLRILKLLTPYYPVILVYSVCISILTLATPISVQSLVSTFSFGPFFQPIFILSIILLGLLTLLGLLKSLQYLMVEYLQQKMYAKVTAIMSEAYFNKAYLPEKGLSDKANRYFDIVLIHKSLSSLIVDGISIVLQTLLGLVLISLYHPIFILFGFVILISILAPLYLFGKKALHSSVEESTSKYKVADYIKQLASANKIEEDHQEFLKVTSKEIDYFVHNRNKHFRTVYTQHIIYMILYALINALLLALGGYLVINNQLSLGQLVAAEIVVNAILSHFLYAKKYLELFYDMYAATVKVYPFYDYIDDVIITKKETEYTDQTAFEKKFYNSIPSVRKIYQPRNYKRFLQLFLLATTVVGLLFISIPWQQFSRSNGKIVAFDPNDRIQTITAPLEGIVEEWLVQDGQVVKKGDPIVRVVDNDPQYLVRLEKRRDAAIAKFEAAKEASDTGKLNYHRQEKLVKEGLSSQKEFEKAKIEYKKLMAGEAAAAAELAKAEVDFSRQQQQMILAPRDGQIRTILLGSGTTRVKEGEALVEFVPNTSETAVELFVDGNDLPLVFPGRKVRLQFEGWPAVQFTGWPSIAIGSFGGVVSVVDPSVSQDGTFRVLVKPDPEDPNHWPNQQFLRQGTRVMGIINLDKVSVGYELWRQINGFPKSMKNSPEYFNLEVKK